MNQSTADIRTSVRPDVIRTRLEFLRNYSHSVVRSGDERLRAAMADYAQGFRLPGERDAA